MQAISSMRYATRYTVKTVYQIAEERQIDTISRGENTNMANYYGTGVKGYIKAKCLVEVSFPIPERGSPDVCCDQCPYFSRTSRTCQLNKQLINYPFKLGFYCPLEFDGEVKEEEECSET